MIYQPQSHCNVCRVKLKASEDDFMGRCKKHPVKFSMLWHRVRKEREKPMKKNKHLKKLLDEIAEERRKSRKYVVSAAVFGTKKEVEEQIDTWITCGTYNDQSVIYEIDDKTPQYTTTVTLKKIK